MNRLERSAVKRVERVLADTLEPLEQIIEFDIGTIGALGRCDVVVTTRALYFFPGGRRHNITRIPYDAIAYAQVHGDRLTVTAHSGDSIEVAFRRPVRRVGPCLQERLACLQPHDEVFEVPGGTVRLRYRPWRDQAMSSWTVDLSSPLLDRDPEVLGAVEAARRRAGDTLRATALEAPTQPVTSDSRERDWTYPAEAWLDWCSDKSGLIAWTAGDQVDRSGSGMRTLLVLSGYALHLVSAPVLRFPFDPHLPPTGNRIELHRIADWELREPEAHGSRLLRLLVCNADQLQRASLDDVIADQGSLLALFGVPAGTDGDRFVDALVAGISASGAYEPASRTTHPLRPAP